MNIQKQKREKTDELKGRVLKCRSELISIGVKEGLDEFCKKYKEFDPKTVKENNKLKNLWYAKITDVNFTTKLEGFVKFKKTEFEN